MSKGIPPRYNTDCEDGYVCVNGVCVKYAGNDLYTDKDGIVVLIDHTNLHPSEIEDGNIWLETDLVPPIMANPQYYLSMVGKWDRGTSDAGPK